MKKYKLGQSKVVFGIKLYQVEALISFGNIEKGDKGGWIEKEENLSQENNAWVSGKPAFQDDDIEFNKLRVMFEVGGVVVAHNAVFDIDMLKREGLNPGRYICTMKVMQAIDKEGKMGNYKLQYLRYKLGLKVPTSAKAHDALGDITVVKELLRWQLPEVGSLEEMMRISTMPTRLARMPFGKHAGALFSEVPKDYLLWLRDKGQAEGDILFTINEVLAGK